MVVVQVELVVVLVLVEDEIKQGGWWRRIGECRRGKASETTLLKQPIEEERVGGRLRGEARRERQMRRLSSCSPLR